VRDIASGIKDEKKNCSVDVRLAPFVKSREGKLSMQERIKVLVQGMSAFDRRLKKLRAAQPWLLREACPEALGFRPVSC
jgi:hypothetical protein